LKKFLSINEQNPTARGVAGKTQLSKAKKSKAESDDDNDDMSFGDEDDIMDMLSDNASKKKEIKEPEAKPVVAVSVIKKGSLEGVSATSSGPKTKSAPVTAAAPTTSLAVDTITSGKHTKTGSSRSPDLDTTFDDRDLGLTSPTSEDGDIFNSAYVPSTAAPVRRGSWKGGFTSTSGSSVSLLSNQFYYSFFL
jgi:hypothetical protein